MSAEYDKFVAVLNDVFGTVFKTDLRGLTESDFEVFKEYLFLNTGVLVSTRTIRRLHKAYILNEGEYTPRSDIKNAIAKAQGYKDWNSLLLNDIKQINQPTLSAWDKKTLSTGLVLRKKKHAIVLIGMLLVLPSIMYFYLKETQYSFTFTSNTTEGYPNYTVSIDYDISEYKSDSLRLYCWPAIDRYLDKSKKVWEKKFHIPGLYRFRLMKQDEILKQIPVFIKSRGWQYSIRPVNKNTIFYSPINRQNGIATMDSTDKKIFNLKEEDEYSVAYINFNHFPASLDSCEITFKFDMQIKPQPFCNYAKLDLWGWNDDIRIGLTDSGCYANAHLEVSDITLEGHKEFLQTNFTGEKSIKIRVFNNNFRLSVDGIKIYETKITQPLGALKGMVFIAGNFANIHSVIIKDGENKVLYSDFLEK